MTTNHSSPLALDTQTHHGDWQIPAVHAALRQYRWATLLGRRAFIRYDDVQALFKDGKHLRTPGPDWMRSSNITEGPLWDWWQLIMFSNNGDSHRRLRGLVNKAFAAHSVESQREGVREIVNDLGDRFEARGEMDAVADFAHWMPARAICRFFGIPESDVPIFARWTTDLGLAFTLRITPEMRHVLNTAVLDLSAYVRELIASRRRQPRNDLLTSLVEARDQGDRLSEDEMIAMVGNVLIGAHDTTKCSITCALLSLMQNPEQWCKLCENPALAAAAAEESVRRDPAVPWLMRVVAEPFAFDDEVSFEPGELIVITPMGANHDPAKFLDSGRFDIERNTNGQLGFGLGPHFCIGSWIARMHLQETLRMFATRFPDMRCVEDTIEWMPLFDFHRPQRLRVRTHH